MSAVAKQRIAEGFAHQRMVVLPLPLAAAASRGAAAYDYIATRIGYFPSAKGHYVERPRGSSELVLIACVHGGGYVSVQTQIHRVVAGEMAVLPPGAAHHYGAADHDPWTIYWLHLGGRRARVAGDLLTGGGRSGVSTMPIDTAVIASFDETYKACTHACTSGDAGLAAIHTGHLLSQLLACRNTAIEWQGRIERAIQVMERRIDSAVEVGELARLVGLSPSHFAAEFKRRTGTSVLNYFIRLKMRRAAILLDTTSLAVQQVARQLGYEDPLYFSRQFRTVYAVSPRAYRAIIKG